MDTLAVTDVPAVRYPTIEERIEANKKCDGLEKEISRLIGHVDAATHRILVLIAELDRTREWHDNPNACAQWLALRCGLDMNTAREKVRTARALEHLPLISAAMEQGKLSYSKARAVTRVACPEVEKELLEIALHSTADQLEKVVRQYRNAKEAAELSRDQQQQRNRHFKYRYNDDGSFAFSGTVPAEVGTMLLRALDAAAEDLPPLEVSAETSQGNYHHSMSIRRADALRALAESYASHGPMPMNGGDRNLISVHVSAETLQHKEAGCCELEDGPSIAAETARRLACDASVVAIIEGQNGEPLNVGRKTRTISAPLRRLLSARDRGCRFPGCNHTRWIDAHHIKHWAEGGETKPSNLVSLCSYHHRRVHEGQIEVVILDDGAIRFVDVSGKSYDSVAPDRSRSFNWREIAAENGSRGIHIDANTAAHRDDPIDYELTAWVLCQRGVKNGRWRPGVVASQSSVSTS